MKSSKALVRMLIGLCLASPGLAWMDIGTRVWAVPDPKPAARAKPAVRSLKEAGFHVHGIMAEFLVFYNESQLENALHERIESVANENGFLVLSPEQRKVEAVRFARMLSADVDFAKDRIVWINHTAHRYRYSIHHEIREGEVVFYIKERPRLLEIPSFQNFFAVRGEGALKFDPNPKREHAEVRSLKSPPVGWNNEKQLEFLIFKSQKELLMGLEERIKAKIDGDKRIELSAEERKAYAAELAKMLAPDVDFARERVVWVRYASVGPAPDTVHHEIKDGNVVFYRQIYSLRRGQVQPRFEYFFAVRGQGEVRLEPKARDMKD